MPSNLKPHRAELLGTAACLTGTVDGTVPRGPNDLTVPENSTCASALLSPPETASCLRLAVQTLARWRCEGRGPAFVRMSGNRVFYRREDVDAFLAGRRFHSTTEADARGA